jgi:O-methyltransferase involved in polyketide biosynthesis
MSTEARDLIERKDLSVTALYTAQTWAWGGFSHATLFSTDQSRVVFGVTNLFIGLAGLLSWGRPSLPHGLLQRHALIEALAQEIDPPQLLELAAGLSSRGLRWPERPTRASEHAVRYIEVDLPHVIDFKRAQVELRAPELFAEGRVEWIGADLKEATFHQWLDPLPTLVIAEGLLMYLDAEEQRALWRSIFEALRPRGGALIFDLVPNVELPKPGLLGRGLGALMSLFTGGQVFQVDTRNRDTICAELAEIGYEEVITLDTHAVASSYGLPYPQKKTQQLIFSARVHPIDDDL